MDWKQLEFVNTSQLKIDLRFRNAAPDVPEETFDEYIRSMRVDGFDITKPIRVDENYVILDGHHRYRAAKKAGILEVPVICLVDGYSENDKERFAFIENTLRRQLSPDNMGAAILGLAEIEEREAKERMLSGTEGAKGEVRNIIRTALGIPKNIVEKALRVRRISNELNFFDLLDDIKKGGSIKAALQSMERRKTNKDLEEKRRKRLEAEKIAAENRRQLIERRKQEWKEKQAQQNIEEVKAQQIKYEEEQACAIIEEEAQKQKILEGFQERYPNSNVELKDIDFSNSCAIDLKSSFKVDPKDNILQDIEQLEEAIESGEQDWIEGMVEQFEKHDSELVEELIPENQKEVIVEIKKAKEEQTKLITFGAKKESDERPKSLAVIIDELEANNVTVFLDLRYNKRALATFSPEEMKAEFESQGIQCPDIDAEPSEESLAYLKRFIKLEIIPESEKFDALVKLYDDEVDFVEVVNALVDACVTGNIAILTDESRAGNDHRGDIARRLVGATDSDIRGIRHI